MKSFKRVSVFFTVATIVLTCCLLTACDPAGNYTPVDASKTDVVKAFNAIVADDDVITQTATAAEQDYIVTLITSGSATEYVLDKNFDVKSKRDVLGAEAVSAEPFATTAADAPSALEKAYAEALRLSGLAEENVVGFDFDRDAYMGKAAYKVEIEEVGAKYKYVLDATDFTLLSSDIEFENQLPTGSYIDENAAKDLALKAAEATEDVSATLVVRSVFEDGRKEYKISFDHEGYRYDISVDAVGGRIVKYSKSALKAATPAVPDAIDSERAKQIALAFVFSDDAVEGEYSFRKVKLDYEDGMFVYEVELIAKGAEYEFEISANGDILDVEIDSEKAQSIPENKRFISRDKAIDAVKQVAGNDIFVTEVEIETEGVGGARTYYYEIEVRQNGAKRKYYVDALSGELLNKTNTDTAVLTEDDAIRIAISEFSLDAAQVVNKIVKLEREDGRLCFKVKLYVGNVKYEAEIDANTGAVLARETEQEGQLPPTGNKLTKDEAIDRVKALLASDAVITEVDFEYENGRYIYEIEVVVGGREYDYYVDATTGEVSQNEHFVSGGNAELTEEEALALAFKEFNVDGARVVIHKIKLEREDGRLCYEIEFFIQSLKYEIEIDARTGAVIEKDVSYD